ncbi:MAG TPA: hypothetical protein VMS54_10700 [Vicinamibacterales bacterium]|nr:hypothetical protein [Vicinamibacterales bacterium]
MKRAIVLAGLMLATSAPLLADVTVKGTGSGKGLGMSGNMVTTTYVKGQKMRVDTVTGDTTRSMIFDVENQKLYMFDNKKKEADVYDMAAFAAEMGKAVEVGAITSNVKPNGQTKQIAGKTASGYDMDISVPASLGGAGGMKMVVKMTGPAWIVKGAPGTADYVAFYRAAAQKGFIFSDPRAAKGNPGQAKAMARMYEQFADIGGIPYETTMDIKPTGEGPMAGMMAKMGSMSMSQLVESVDTAAIPAETFAPPAGYKINEKK